MSGISEKVAAVEEENDTYTDLPSPRYVPLRRAPTENESENLAKEKELLRLKGEISRIAGIPAKEHSHKYKIKLYYLKRKEKKIKAQLGINLEIRRSWITLVMRRSPFLLEKKSF